uniref:Uncharacterized protein n=1 Tax=Anguilla anguilla TaxID=7936 RepID=A0A0E9WSU6_ANGAN
MELETRTAHVPCVRARAHVHGIDLPFPPLNHCRIPERETKVIVGNTVIGFVEKGGNQKNNYD